MKRKGEAHEALSLLFHESGVPHTMVADGSKEQMMGDFRKKARQADCYLKQTEPYTPWSNAAEGSIKELKRGTGRQMLKRRSPKRLWDHCAELQGLIRSHTDLGIFSLNDEVPEMNVTGQTGRYL